MTSLEQIRAPAAAGRGGRGHQRPTSSGSRPATTAYRMEALRSDVTPAGLHYLLTHYDIPDVDPADLAAGRSTAWSDAAALAGPRRPARAPAAAPCG